MDLHIAGRVAAVAAGSSGLGLGAARALLAEGCQVVICGRDRMRLDAAVAALRLEAADEVKGSSIDGVVADIGTPEGAAGFIDTAVEMVGKPVDILIANAGGPPTGDFELTDVNAYPAALDLNLLSTVAMCKAVVPGMRTRGWGRVVAITSLAVRQPMPNLILSNTARAGATGFLKTLAREVADDGVTVNSVQPGIHDTPRLDALYTPEQKAAMRMGDPDDFGSVVAFLCGEQAAFTTGVQLHVDGGAYAALL